MEDGVMVLSRSLATMAVVAFLTVTGVARAQELQPSTEASVKLIEKAAEDAARLKSESQWTQFRELVTAAELVHQQASTALAEQQKRLDESRRELDAALARIDRPQIMVQAILAEVRDLDDEVLKAACQRVSADRIQPIELGKPTDKPLVYSLNSEQAGRLLAVIEKRRSTQVLSRPSILAVDGQIAEITVGQRIKRPVAARVSPKNETKVESRDETIGLVMSLIPSIQDKQRIRLELIVDDSYLSGETVPIFVEANGKTIDSPLINRAKMQTVMETPDGRTLLVAVRSRKPADETEPTKTTLMLLTPRIVDRTAAAGEFLHH
jgi:Flp pilus assembly secretin CpaC